MNRDLKHGAAMQHNTRQEERETKSRQTIDIHRETLPKLLRGMRWRLPRRERGGEGKVGGREVGKRPDASPVKVRGVGGVNGSP